MTGLTDERELMDRCAGGDRDAYARLYSGYLSALLKYIYLFTKSRELSEEIVQDVFVKIWEKKEGLLVVQGFQAYIFKIAKNHLLDHIRKEQSQSRFFSLTAPFSEACDEQADDDLIYGQYYQLAQDAINLLPEKRKQVFEMKTREELSLDEIADQLGISKSVVKKQLYAATGFVKDYLKRHGEITADMVIFMYFFLPI
ncbi:sigma-70 family RNA polymerase sigma factor [Dyadobacter sp. CY345]|uniref:RNA polymerase sigma factor n=1 Tax=Dyadobacter sp. CY345 TaxID=2909335 RepID=UPI001F289266|nr:sigma-70 family RNA polymerase sigma factor [Dyadobacter sp. CY345]MCF2443562.1 sigma-70 family RNA polymerase sigma factor [Dyadobacter sp. CY345]